MLKTFGVVEQCSLTCFHGLLKLPCTEEEKCFTITIHLTLEEYLRLLRDIKAFLNPLKEHKALWIHVNQFSVLSQYVNSYFQEHLSHQIPMDAFASALSESIALLIRIIRNDQSLTHMELTFNGSLPNPLKSKELMAKEFRALNALIQLKVNEDDFDENITILEDMFSLLLNYHQFISVLIEVVSNFDLQGCLDDTKLVELKTILEDCGDSKRHYMTLEVASGYVKALRSTLMLDKSEKHMALFNEVSTCRVFHKFITDQFFPTGLEDVNQGANSFRAWYEIISNQLQNVEFEQQVLHHLSLAFEYILPFVDKRKNLEQLMSAVIQLNSVSDFQELRTVASNMHHIERWSSQAEV
jgi:hypothetical protein